MTDAEDTRARIATARAMRELPDELRDELILAAGRKVIDARGIFADRQKQVALTEAYRAPGKPKGAA